MIVDPVRRLPNLVRGRARAELSQGDAIFIPRDWFHHVEALARFNILVNYWWDAGRDGAKERNIN